MDLIKLVKSSITSTFKIYQKKLSIYFTKFRNIGRIIRKEVKTIIRGAIKYVFGKPESLKDYFKIEELYISKIFIVRIILAVSLITVLTVKFIIPGLSGRLWTNTVVVNTDKYYTADGKVNVLDNNNQVIYKGIMTEGRITGTGEVYDYGNLIYKGELSNEKYQGQGKLYQDGQLLYEGEFSDNLYNGLGVLYYSSGSKKFDGIFKDGLYSEGTEYYENGNIKYQGGFSDGKYNGAGKIYSDNAQIWYDGNLVMGEYDGQGKLYKDGILLYEGNFTKGIYSGLGKKYYSNGVTEYEGNFKDGMYSGEGRQYYENGRLKYDGQFLDNNYCGEGTLYSLNTGKYIYSGTFTDNVYDVNGKLYDEQTGRLKYEGDFSNGIYDGAGVLYNSNGQPIFTGNFYMGEIDYKSFCGEKQEEVRKAFGKEDDLVQLENSFLMVYRNLNVIFEFDYVYTESSPAVNKIKIFNKAQIDNVANGKNVKEIRESFGSTVFSEYEFIVNEEDAFIFEFAEKRLYAGQQAYSIKYILEDSYIRIYSQSDNSEVIYYEIGGF